MRTTPTRSPLPDLRCTAALVVALAAVVVVLPGSPSASTGATTRVTLIGDSIMASFDYVPSARRSLGRGLDLRASHAVCRRLVAASCPYNGSSPTTALDVVHTRGRTLGPVVVINVGYNDWAAVYDVDRMMRALRSAGVRRVVWVTLREAGSNAHVYSQSNARIRAADRKWKQLVVADWNAHSRGRPWFRSDGLHLTTTGAMAMARLLRPLVIAGAAS